MSIQEPPKFTPAQVLDAGRRAETEGRHELAVKFYRHLTESYPGTGEAAAAQSALARLPAGHAPTALNGRRPPPGQPMQAASYEPQRYDAPALGPHLGNPFNQQRGPEPAYTSQHGAAPNQPSQGHPYQSEVGAQVELPRFRRRYKTSRFIGAIATWLGGLLALAGLALLPVTIFSPRLLAALPVIGSTIGNPVGAGSIAAYGLCLLVAGQLTRALLDQADASRDMAEIARAEAEARHGSPARSRRR